MITQTDLIERERLWLAPYAMHAADSCGRVYAEPEHPYRTCYQRDRDRIIHSTAFRRLEYKTQVFVNHEGDYYRTRLTHTLEATQIGRSIARAMRLNEDLVETISLTHDIGHPPFGHSGESALRDLMEEHGGFDHNLQGLRIVDYLERRYPEFPGLNLTGEVREAIDKHRTLVPRSDGKGTTKPMPMLEAQVANMADEIAYDTHDIDDGLTSGLLEHDDLMQIELWSRVVGEVDREYSNITPSIRKYQAIRRLINWQITDIVEHSESCIAAANIDQVDDVRRHHETLIGFSGAMRSLREPLRAFLFTNLYHHYRVVRMADKAHRFLQDLFRVYVAKPEQLPPNVQSQIKDEDTHRVVCDYIAGMTDRFALDEHKKLFEPYERV